MTERTFREVRKWIQSRTYPKDAQANDLIWDMERDMDSMKGRLTEARDILDLRCEDDYFCLTDEDRKIYDILDELINEL